MALLYAKPVFVSQEGRCDTFVKELEVRLVRGGRFARGAIYIGRPTRFGNPYRVRDVGSYEEAVRLYEAYFRERTRDPRFLGALEALFRRLKRDGALTLSCHCAPRPCYGEVIARWLAERGREEGYRVRMRVEWRGGGAPWLITRS